MRYLNATTEEINRVSQELSLNQKAYFKGTEIICSKIKAFWFMDVEGLVVADSLEELLFDLNDLQRSIDFDNEVKATRELKKSFDTILK